MSDTFDVVVIGAGPAGYIAAIRAAQLGLNTACIDEFSNRDNKPAPGGTCLNVGCIPSKALLESSEQYHRLTHQFAAHGIEVSNVRMNVATMLARKDQIVSQLTGGIATLFKANGVQAYHGHGRLNADRSVTVLSPNGAAGDPSTIATLCTTHVIIATGSVPVAIPSIPFDGEFIVDSTGALEFSDVPKRLGVIGAGVIGLELGSVWSRLGAECILLEALDSFLPTCDTQIAKDAQRQFKKQGLDIRLNCRVEQASVNNGQVEIVYTNDTQRDALTVDKLIVAVGRKPNTENLFAGDVQVTLTDRGFIDVDSEGRTSMENVWAAGDVTPGPMLAHKGSEEGVAVAERIVTGIGHVNYNTIPWVIYTAPEIAWAGLSEQQAIEAGHDVATGSFPYAASGRAKAMQETSGMVKFVTDAHTDRILGVHMIGAHASELIAEVVVAMEFGASSEDIARTVHAHPTLSEIVHEAALSVDKRALHKVN